MAELRASPDRHDGDELRRLLSRGDLRGFLDAVADGLPGTPGGRTRRTNVEGALQFLRWAQDDLRGVLHPDDRLAADYRAHLERKHGGSTASVANRLTHARNLYRALKARDAVEGNPFETLRQANPVRLDRHELYSEPEVARLVAFAEGAEDRALILAGAHAGLATREVLSLAWPDVRLDRGWLEVRGRVIPLSSEALEAFTAHARREGAGPLLGREGRAFPLTERQLLYRLFMLCRAANVPYRPWRALRNTAARRWLRQGTDDRRAAKKLGLSRRPRRHRRKLQADEAGH